MELLVTHVIRLNLDHPSSNVRVGLRINIPHVVIRHGYAMAQSLVRFM